MSDIRLQSSANSSDQDVSFDSGIFIPRRLSPQSTPRLTSRERAKKAAFNTIDEDHWRRMNQRHLNTGIPAQTVSLVSAIMAHYINSGKDRSIGYNIICFSDELKPKPPHSDMGWLMVVGK